MNPIILWAMLGAIVSYSVARLMGIGNESGGDDELTSSARDGGNRDVRGSIDRTRSGDHVANGQGSVNHGNGSGIREGARNELPTGDHAHGNQSGDNRRGESDANQRIREKQILEADANTGADPSIDGSADPSAGGENGGTIDASEHEPNHRDHRGDNPGDVRGESASGTEPDGKAASQG